MARIRDVRYVAYATPDLETEKAFYIDTWGLTPIEGSTSEIVYLAAQGSDEKFVVRLRKDETKRLDLIAWAAPSRSDVDALHAAVKAAGRPIVAEPHTLTSPGGGYGFRFFDPDGHTVEISFAVERGPSRTIKRGEALPERISHVVIHSPDHKGAVNFYTEVLGFRVSDWLGDFMCFLRCNSWHHRLAFLPGAPAIDHVAYDVPTVDDMMKGIARLKRANTDILWGPGRHTAGDNTFSYFQTPSGFLVEYTSGLIEVDDEAHQHTVHKPSLEVMDQWGYGVGGPQTMPKFGPDAGLFKAPAA